MTVSTVLSQRDVKLITYQEIELVSSGLLKLLCKANHEIIDFEPTMCLHNKLEGHYITTEELQKVINAFFIFLHATPSMLPKTKQKLATIANLKYMYNVIKKII